MPPLAPALSVRDDGGGCFGASTRGLLMPRLPPLNEIGVAKASAEKIAAAPNDNRRGISNA